jgi:hypothetical protein
MTKQRRGGRASYRPVCRNLVLAFADPCAAAFRYQARALAVSAGNRFRRPSLASPMRYCASTSPSSAARRSHLAASPACGGQLREGTSDRRRRAGGLHMAEVRSLAIGLGSPLAFRRSAVIGSLPTAWDRGSEAGYTLARRGETPIQFRFDGRRASRRNGLFSPNTGAIPRPINFCISDNNVLISCCGNHGSGRGEECRMEKPRRAPQVGVLGLEVFTPPLRAAKPADALSLPLLPHHHTIQGRGLMRRLTPMSKPPCTGLWNPAQKLSFRCSLGMRPGIARGASFVAA